MSNLILDTLDESGLQVFKKLRSFNETGVLVGGTALALQIGHRRSFDFDIFTYQPLKHRSILDKVKRIFGSGCVKTYQSQEQINLVTPTNEKLTFYYPEHQPSQELIKTGYMNLLSIKDIATNKAYTIGFRGKWRDYVDMYFILKDKIATLEEIVRLSEQRFGGSFSTRLFLQQLVYFDDIKNFEITFLRDETPADEIQNFLVAEANKVLQLTMSN